MLFIRIEEDITDEDSIAELVSRNADASIFTKLELTYGKAIKLKKDIQHLVPTKSSDRQMLPTWTSPAIPCKPTMADVTSFSPEIKQLYLTKYVQNHKYKV